MKLYTWRADHMLYYCPKIVAEITQANVESVVIPKGTETEEFLKKKQHGQFPILELNDGSMIFESTAIASYLANTSKTHAKTLTGGNAFESAQIQQWQNFGVQCWSHVLQIMLNTLGYKFDNQGYNDSVKQSMAKCKILNAHLEGKMFMVGNRFTLADICLFTNLMALFQLAYDAEAKKQMPCLTAWFERVSKQSAVMNVCGVVRMSNSPIKPVDASKAVAVAVPVVKVEEKKADDDDFDPFADDDEEDEEAEKAKQARFKEIAKTAKSYGKTAAIAKSIIIWEVKPWGEETDLVALAKKIIAIEKDGLFWKTEWKKEPIAYGVFKIVIGATIEDDKISTDDIQELIEAFEDEVQSVDIQAFNKL